MRPLMAILITVASAGAAAGDDLARRAHDLISQKCFACHGRDEKKIKSDLELRTRTTALKGGERGPAIVPGNAEQSLLYEAITRRDPDLSMPPKDSDALSAEQM